MAATLYGCTGPLQELRYGDGVSQVFSMAKNATRYPGAVLFDQIVPPGETVLNASFSMWELDNAPVFYRIIEDPWSSDKNMGSFAVAIPVTGDSTITVSNGNMQADLTTTLRYVY